MFRKELFVISQAAGCDCSGHIVRTHTHRLSLVCVGEGAVICVTCCSLMDEVSRGEQWCRRDHHTSFSLIPQLQQIKVKKKKRDDAEGASHSGRCPTVFNIKCSFMVYYPSLFIHPDHTQVSFKFFYMT